jgi:hypothetical protein
MLFGLDYTHWTGIAMMLGGAVGLLWSNRDKFASLIPSFGGSSGDGDTLDFKAWARLRQRKSLQCPECQAAFKTLGAHFMETPE